MIKRFIHKVSCAFALLKIGGIKSFLNQVKRQVYSHHVQVGREKTIDDKDCQPGAAKIKYSFQAASKEDMETVFQLVASESKESAQLLLNRKWLYESGFGKWYVAKAADTGEPCYLQGVIEPDDNRLLEDGFKGWFPRLQKEEFLIEGAYTFEKYRGKGLCDAVVRDIVGMEKAKGFRRMITYARKDNVASQKAADKTGFRNFEEIPVTKILFFTIYHKKRPVSGVQPI